MQIRVRLVGPFLSTNRGARWSVCECILSLLVICFLANLILIITKEKTKAAFFLSCRVDQFQTATASILQENNQQSNTRTIKQNIKLYDVDNKACLLTSLYSFTCVDCETDTKWVRGGERVLSDY